MKVLLSQDVEKLGYLGDIVEVSTGYARNYLIPHDIATAPTKANIKALSQEKAKRAEERLKERQRMEKAIQEVNGAEVAIAAKCNEQGHLFGSVTKNDIAGNLRERGFQVADDIVQLSEHIKTVGKKEITLKFADDLTAVISITIIAADEEIREKLRNKQEVENEPVDQSGQAENQQE